MAQSQDVNRMCKHSVTLWIQLCNTLVITMPQDKSTKAIKSSKYGAGSAGTNPPSVSTSCSGTSSHHHHHHHHYPPKHRRTGSSGKKTDLSFSQSWNSQYSNMDNHEKQHRLWHNAVPNFWLHFWCKWKGKWFHKQNVLIQHLLKVSCWSKNGKYHLDIEL